MHDANGTALKIGDKVLIPAVITDLSTGDEEYCNVTVETTLGRRPDGAKQLISATNTGILVKVSSAEVKLNL